MIRGIGRCGSKLIKRAVVAGALAPVLALTLSVSGAAIAIAQQQTVPAALQNVPRDTEFVILYVPKGTKCTDGYYHQYRSGHTACILSINQCLALPAHELETKTGKAWVCHDQVGAR
jgi:hypothetical protein